MLVCVVSCTSYERKMLLFYELAQFFIYGAKASFCHYTKLSLLFGQDDLVQRRVFSNCFHPINRVRSSINNFVMRFEPQTSSSPMLVFHGFKQCGRFCPLPQYYSLVIQGTDLRTIEIFLFLKFLRFCHQPKSNRLTGQHHQPKR